MFITAANEAGRRLCFNHCSFVCISVTKIMQEVLNGLWWSTFKESC